MHVVTQFISLEAKRSICICKWLVVKSFCLSNDHKLTVTWTKAFFPAGVRFSGMVLKWSVKNEAFCVYYTSVLFLLITGSPKERLRVTWKAPHWIETYSSCNHTQRKTYGGMIVQHILRTHIMKSSLEFINHKETYMFHHILRTQYSIYFAQE